MDEAPLLEHDRRTRRMGGHGDAPGPGPSILATDEVPTERPAPPAWFGAVAALPLPGHGSTWERWRRLAALGATDLVHARLGEGHADAVAILAELAPGSPAPVGTFGVWAAEAPRHGVRAERSARGWTVHGERGWCSGASTIEWALLTAHTEAGVQLLVVPMDAPGVMRLEGSWPSVGMAGSDSLTVRFDQVLLPADAAVGDPGAYTSRPGFWHGAIGVAACWYGGAVGVAQALVEAARVDPQPHRLAHLGAVDSVLSTLAQLLQSAARAVDDDPLDRRRGAHLRALRVRAAVEQGCEQVLAHTGRGTGAKPLCLDEGHSRRVADLTTYLRQSHAEVDLASAGAAVLERTGAVDDWLPA